MRRLTSVIFGLIVFCAADGAFGASVRTAQRSGAIPVATTTAAILSEARPPIGWTDFCLDHPEDCDVPTRAPADIELTASAWTRLQHVNRFVNGSIEQVEDSVHFGVTEKWAYPDDGRGDCEDLVLLKRRLLMAEGFPRQALLITVVRDREDAGHAILTVKTDRGDFILDNKDARIRAWEATGYTFVKRQSQDNPNRWVMIGPPAPSGLTVAGH